MRKLIIIPFMIVAIVMCFSLNALFTATEVTAVNDLPKTLEEISQLNKTEGLPESELPIDAPCAVSNVTGGEAEKNVDGLKPFIDSSTAASYAKFMESNIDLDDVSVDTQTSILADMIKKYKFDSDKVSVISGTGKDFSGSTDALQELVDQKNHEVSFLAIRLRDGAAIGYKVDEFRQSCSTIKVPMTLYAAKLIQKGELKYTTPFTYTRESYMNGSGVIAYDYEYGQRFKLKTLISYAIEYSDNVAYQMLCVNLGVENMYDYIESIGGKVPYESKKEERFWPDSDCRSAALWWNQVYLFKDSDEVGEWYWDLLEDAPSRIKTALSGKKECYTKTGSSTYCMHEAGIVMGDEPYMIIVFTKSYSSIQSYFNKIVRAIDALICS